MRFLLLPTLALSLVAAAAPALAAAGLAVDDKAGDVTLASRTPQKYKKLKASADLLEAAVVASGSKVVFTARTAKPLRNIEPSANRRAGVTFELCSSASDTACDGTLVFLTLDNATTVEVSQQPDDGSSCDGATAKVSGTLVTVKVPATCVDQTDDVTLQSRVLVRIGTMQKGALLSDDTPLSEVGSA